MCLCIPLSSRPCLANPLHTPARSLPRPASAISRAKGTDSGWDSRTFLAHLQAAIPKVCF